MPWSLSCIDQLLHVYGNCSMSAMVTSAIEAVIEHAYGIHRYNTTTLTFMVSYKKRNIAHSTNPTPNKIVND